MRKIDFYLLKNDFFRNFVTYVDIQIKQIWLTKHINIISQKFLTPQSFMFDLGFEAATTILYFDLFKVGFKIVGFIPPSSSI